MHSEKSQENMENELVRVTKLKNCAYWPISNFQVGIVLKSNLSDVVERHHVKPELSDHPADVQVVKSYEEKLAA